MPFKSKAQARYLLALKPSIAKEFTAKTKSMANLPERKKSNKKTAKPNY